MTAWGTSFKKQLKNSLGGERIYLLSQTVCFAMRLKKINLRCRSSLGNKTLDVLLLFFWEFSLLSSAFSRHTSETMNKVKEKISLQSLYRKLFTNLMAVLMAVFGLPLLIELLTSFCATCVLLLLIFLCVNQPPPQTSLGVRHAFLRDEPLRTSAGEAMCQ